MASNICSWAGLWEAAPDLDAARQGHTATVLKNGKILVCGGTAGATTVGTALLFDPATRAYTPAGSLAVPRHGHQATRLKDGNVLVTGGFSGTAQLASAELYNWMTGAWSLLPAPMSSRRQDHTATLTNSGNVLLVGGFGGAQAFSVILDTIEIFTLTTSTFTALIHKMQVPRMGHTATMQPNGAILVAGGLDINGPVQLAETYDPNHPPFAPAGSMTTPRAMHTATLLSTGGVLLAGGAGPLNFNGSAHVIQASAEIFNGTSFQAAGSMASPRAAHAAVDLGNGRVLLCGGEDGNGPLASAEIFSGPQSFEPAGSMATARARLAAAPTGDGDVLVCGGKSIAGTSGGEVASSEMFDPLFRLSKNNLTEGRERATATRLGSENALVIGGRNSSGPPQALASVLLYRGTTDEFSLAGTIATGRLSHTATLLASPDRMLIVGGSNAANQSLASAELFDIASSAVVPVGQPTGARAEHTATLLPGGKVLIAGGSHNGAPLATAELYDPATNSFSATTGSLTYGRFGHSATLLPNGTVLLAGGMSTDSAVPGGTGITFTTEIFDPATGLFTLQPQPNRMQVNRSFHSTTLLGNGKVLFAGGLSVSIQPTAKAELYDPASNSFALTGSMLGPRYRHTATPTAMPNGQVMMVGGWSAFNATLVRAVELYDPSSGAFTRKGDSWFARALHAAVLTSKQKVLVIGGTVAGVYETAEISKPTDCTVQAAPPTSGCFIATAAFGSELHPAVERLRTYRDRVLMPSAAGRLFVRGYYRCSPPVASLVARSAGLRALVRFFLR